MVMFSRLGGLTIRRSTDSGQPIPNVLDSFVSTYGIQSKLATKGLCAPRRLQQPSGDDQEPGETEGGNNIKVRRVRLISADGRLDGK